MNKKSSLLTPLELKIMNILWRLKKGFLKEIVEAWPADPNEKKPHHNTIATTIRILEDKSYIEHETFGRMHQYSPKMSRLDYQKKLLTNVIENAFSGSATSLVSALMDNDKVSNEELNEIQDLINDSKKE